jgi:hypothetical protein
MDSDRDFGRIEKMVQEKSNVYSKEDYQYISRDLLLLDLLANYSA